MTFRDDHDATLARAEALERELEAAKAKLETNDEEQAKLRAEIARLRERADSPHPRDPASPAEMQRAALKSALIGGAFITFALGVIVVAIWYAKSMRNSSSTTESMSSSCTLSTVPSGAEIYDSRGTYVGTTPITKPRRTWEGMDDLRSYEARLPGHQPAPVVLPTHGAKCDTRVRLLP